MKKSSSPSSFRACAAAILLLFAFRVAAVDPLPPELERASPAAQAAWWDKMGRDSERDKIEVGKKRYEQRLAFKQTMMSHLQADAQARRDEILNVQSVGADTGEALPASGTMRNVILFGLIFGTAAYLVRRRLMNTEAAE